MCIRDSSYVAPLADFSFAGDPTVAFTDLSTNTPSAWDWEFGDGATSTEQNPTHTYLIDGDYNVCLTAVSYTHLRAHETVLDLVCRLLLEKKKIKKRKKKNK